MSERITEKQRMEALRRLKPAEVLKIRAAAQSVAFKMGYPELGDDFAQEVFLHYNAKKPRKMVYLFIDFLRHTYGRYNRSQVEEFQEQEFVHPDPFYQKRSQTASDFDTLRNIEDENRGLAAFEAMDEIVAKMKDPLIRALYRLCFQWGLQQRDLADLFDVHEARICQIFKESRKAYLKGRFHYTWTPQMGRPRLWVKEEANE